MSWLPVAAPADPHVPPAPAGLVVAGVATVAVATVAGAWLARRDTRQREVWLGAAAGALLVIAGVHLLPDALSAARAAGISWWLVPAAAVASFLLAGLVARAGCTCDEDREQVSGAGTAGALAVHRFLEGSAIALTGSVSVAIALAVHALGEGLAAGALLRAQPGRRVAAWLAAMCISPALGAVTASTFRTPAAAEPVLLAVAAGVLAQASRVSLRAAFHHLRPGRVIISRPAAAVAVAAAITVLAVRAVG
jgi:ZIP family zinc transporter